MNVIITGATGSLGRALVQHFAAKGDHVYAYGRWKNPPEPLAAIAHYFSADITQPLSFPEAEVCIHAAALSDDKGEEQQFLDANVNGTLNVMRAAKQCRVFIYISSSSVYMPAPFPLREEEAGRDGMEDLSAYGRSKLLSENALKEQFNGTSCFILRPRALYGPGDIKILPRMLKLVKNETIFRPGPMQIRVSMTHYRNLMAAIDCCIANEATGVRTYNVSDEQTYILADVVRKLMAAIYGKPLAEKQRPVWLLKALAKFHIGGITPLLVRSLTNDMVLDISRMKKEMQYRAVTDFDQSLPELTAWVKSAGGPEVLREAEKTLAWK